MTWILSAVMSQCCIRVIVNSMSILFVTNAIAIEIDWLSSFLRLRDVVGRLWPMV